MLLMGCSGGLSGETPSSSPSPTTVTPGGTFGDLTFSDEFDESEINTTKWNVADEHQDMWPDNPWRRNFKAENVYLEDGALVIRTTQEEVGYSTGCMGTDGPGEAMYFEQAFGRFEARIKFPSQPGHGGAFWLFTEGVFSIDGSGRDGSEIDIVETIWLDDQVDHAVHWDGYGDEHQSDARFVTGMGLDDHDWHVYRLDWYPDQYVFSIDGVQTWRTSAGGVAQVPAFVLVCDEIVPWGTGPIEDATLPDYLYFDYVRVYEYVPPGKSE